MRGSCLPAAIGLLLLASCAYADDAAKNAPLVAPAGSSAVVAASAGAPANVSAAANAQPPLSVSPLSVALPELTLPKRREFLDLDPQVEAHMMLDRARRISDIRAPGAAPFMLKARFSFIGDDLETYAGTYTEFWSSETKWRKEIEVGDRKRVEVAGGNKLWETETDAILPEKALRVEFAADVFPARWAPLDFQFIDDDPHDIGLRCALTNPVGPRQKRSALCFDTASGALLQNIVPQMTRHHVTDFSCAYGKFEMFGPRFFPRAMDCRLGGHKQMEIEVTELRAENFADTKLFDSKLFDAPLDAMELGRCGEEAIGAKIDYSPAPTRPAGMRNPDDSPSVTLRMIVDVNGAPQNIKVVRPAGKPLDELAVGTVKRWRFKPATCKGEPMPEQAEFNVMFSDY